MRILLVSQSFPPDPGRGAERVCEFLAEALSQSGHHVSVLAIGNATEQRDAGPYSVHRLRFGRRMRPGAKKLQLGVAGKLLWHARNAWGGIDAAELTDKLRELAPDVVYIHNASGLQPQLFRVCEKLGLPAVVHLHDYALMCPRTTMYHNGKNCEEPCRNCRALTFLWRHAAGSVGHVIAISEFVASRYRKSGVFPNAEWHVVYNDDHTGTQGYQPKSDGPFAFGYIGALTEAKGLNDLIDAFKALPPNTAKLVIAGSGDDDFVSSLVRRAKNIDVTWLGQVDPNMLYSSIDCLIVPSRWHEPQGLVVVEGLRRGLPIIASDRGGIPELLKNRPPHILFDPDDIATLTSAMTLMIRNFPVSTDRVEFGMENTSRIESILRLASERSIKDA